MDLSTCLAWKNKHVCLFGKDSVLREGEIVHVAASFLAGDDVDLVVRLIDGSVTSVRASEQGRTWKFADASDRPAA
jgi:hypothetical protein